MTSDQKIYHSVQIILHWTVAILILYQYVLSSSFSDKNLEKCQNVGMTGSECEGLLPHYVVGSILLGLMLIRVGFRVYFGAPPHPKAVPYFIKTLAKLSHLTLYLLVILMPLTGLLGWHTNSETLLFMHSVISNCLVVLILTHICAVGFHEGILGSQLFYRMGSLRKKN